MIYRIYLSILIIVRLSFCSEYGESCNYGGNGTCEDSCQETAEHMCGLYKNSIPLFCCITGTDEKVLNLFGPPEVRISETKCNEYNSINSSSLHLIANGYDINSTSAPYAVALAYNENGKIKYRCGGTLISDKWVLTAAHCVAGKKAVRARLGDSQLLAYNSNRIVRDIVDTLLHKDYKSLHYDDIALLELNETVVFTDVSKPACLWTKDIIPVNLTLASGWGQTDIQYSDEYKLRQVKLYIFNNSECRGVLEGEMLPSGFISSLICARNPNGGDTCMGDSGGPLVISYNQSNLYYVVGITSFGVLCGGNQSFGGYTRVSSYIDWIESIVWSN